MICHYCAKNLEKASMSSKYMCKHCSAYRSKTGIKNDPIIPIVYEYRNPYKRDFFALKGLICEDFIYNQLSSVELASKYKVSSEFVYKTLTSYLDRSQTIYLTFIPIE